MNAINIPNYGDLSFIDSNYLNFLRRTTICYGPSETGKSIIIRWIMNILSPYIPQIIVICPTNSSNLGYTKCVPKNCIFTDIKPDIFRSIWKRQECATALYNKVNDPTILRNLCAKANNFTINNHIKKIEENQREKLDLIDRSSILNFAQKMEQSDTIKNSANKQLIKLYKAAIGKCKYTNLTKDEEISVKFLNFNPNLLLIMDDCQAQIAEWIKDPTICELFYQGRHNYVSTIMSMQSDTGKPGLAPGIRNSVFNSIFTDPNVAMRFFQNKENGFDLQTKKDASKIISEIFKSNTNGIDNFKRLVYSRLDKVAKLRYLIADENPNLKFGCASLWDYCDKIPKNETDDDNKFKSMFNI